MHSLAFRGDDEDGLFHFHDGLVQVLVASQETYINDGCLVEIELGSRVVTDQSPHLARNTEPMCPCPCGG